MDIFFPSDKSYAGIDFGCANAERLICLARANAGKEYLGIDVDKPDFLGLPRNIDFFVGAAEQVLPELKKPASEIYMDFFLNGTQNRSLILDELQPHLKKCSAVYITETAAITPLLVGELYMAGYEVARIGPLASMPSAFFTHSALRYMKLDSLARQNQEGNVDKEKIEGYDIHKCGSMQVWLPKGSDYAIPDPYSGLKDSFPRHLPSWAENDWIEQITEITPITMIARLKRP
ncbi:MAG: hypothetical protein HGA85_03025 [Nanoarchaeota archaeon]|nr:hypothetical protein [Nanoarchaeota archaeon]